MYSYKRKKRNTNLRKVLRWLKSHVIRKKHGKKKRVGPKTQKILN